MKLSHSSEAQSSALTPDWKPEIRRRLVALYLAPTREAAIIEELAQRLDDCYAESLSSGATEAEAYRAALAELSESELLVRELRRVQRQVALEPIILGTTRRTNMIADLWQDLRYGARMLLKTPGLPPWQRSRSRSASAQTIFPRRKIGHLREGYEASFIVLRGNSLENFERVRIRRISSIRNFSQRSDTPCCCQACQRQRRRLNHIPCNISRSVSCLLLMPSSRTALPILIGLPCWGRATEVSPCLACLRKPTDFAQRSQAPALPIS
jgi:hypothetical protein